MAEREQSDAVFSRRRALSKENVPLSTLMDINVDTSSLPNREEITIPSNSVGILIGTGGSTLGRIQDMTGAHIFVDRTNSGRVEIAGDAASVAAAKEEIHSVVTFGDTSKQRARGEACEVINVPKIVLGKVVGFKGATIKKIEDETKTIISSSLDNSGAIQIRGTPEAISLAKEEINRIVDEAKAEERKEGRQISSPKALFSGHTMTIASSPSREVMTIPAALVGVVIGSRGSTKRRIQSMTNTRIRLGYSDDTGGTSALEITGSEANIAAAKEEIHDVLTFGDAAYKPNVSGQVREVITVPKSMVNRIIGVKGATIAKIQAETNSVITPSRDSSGPIKIGGTPEAIALAKEQINRMVKEVLDKQHCRKMSVPRTVVTDIMGPGGATIFKIEQQTGTEISLSNHGEMEILGQESAVDDAERLIKDIVSQNQIGEEEIISVPVNFRWAIVGRGGSTVKQIEQETGTRISVSALDDPTIAISGSRDGIDAAKGRIEELCQTLAPAFTSPIVIRQ